MDQRFQLSLDTSPVGEMISMSEEELKQATEPSAIGKIPLVNDFVEGGYFFYQNKIKGKGWDEYQYSPISNNLLSPREQKDKSFMTLMEIAGGFIGASQATHTHGSLTKALQNTGKQIKNLPNKLKNLPKNIKALFSKVKPPLEDTNRAVFAEYTDDLIKNMSKPSVENTQLKSLLDDLYRKGAKVGNGSTADALRYELATGNKVGGRQHFQKAQDYARALDSWLSKNASALPGDRAAAENVLKDLMSALGGN